MDGDYILNDPIKQLHARQKDIVTIIITAVLLALVINLFAVFISTATSENPCILIIFIILLLLLVIYIISKYILKANKCKFSFTGAIAYKLNGKKVLPIEIYGYEFNNDFARHLASLINEDQTSWEILNEFHLSSGDPVCIMNRFEPNKQNYHTIINSILEYTILYKLQIHLDSYFLNNNIDKSSIVTLDRNHLSEKVLENKVLKHITLDMSKRPSFSSRDFHDTKDVISANGEDGVQYHRLMLKLPPKSEINRNDDGFLVITNPQFELTIKPIFQGFSSYVPEVLLESDISNYHQFEVRLLLCVHLRNTIMLSSNNLEMYEWLDSFLEDLNEYFSIEQLEKRLNPDLISILNKKYR